MKYQRLFIAVSLGVLLLFLAVQYAVYNGVREQAIAAMHAEQLAKARLAATGIEDYMGNVVRTLTLLSEVPDIVNLNARGRTILGHYRRFSPAEIRGITRVDSGGRIVYTFPDIGLAGRDISGQPHVALAKRTRDVVISDVFMAVQGFRAVAVHVPVFDGKEFNGTLAYLLSFDRIAENYIGSIEVGKGGYAWVLSQNGAIISAPDSARIGGDARALSGESPDLLALVEKMTRGEEGVATSRYGQIGAQPADDQLNYVAYRPIRLRNTLWSIAVSEPEAEVTGSLAGLRTQLLIATAVLLLVYGFAMYRILRSQAILDEERKERAVDLVVRESEERYRTLFEQNPAPTLIYERGTLKLLTVNEAFQRHYGYSAADIATMRLPDLYPDDQKKRIADLSSMLKGYKNVGEWVHLRKDGSKIHIIAVSNDLLFQGRPSRIAVITDVTERNRAEELVRASNMEKEVLLKEIHHRVKNNLQVICSLLGLESGRIADPATRGSFIAAADRVRSMAVVHETMYRSQSFSEVDVAEQLRSVTAQLQRGYPRPGIECTVDAEGIRLGMNTAIPVGLIVSELVTNALKHAFTDSEGGTIRVRMTRDDSSLIRLSVRDDGVGFPAGLNWRESPSVGMTLLVLLSEQLGGKLSLERNGGTEFILEFSPIAES